MTPAPILLTVAVFVCLLALLYFLAVRVIEAEMGSVADYRADGQTGAVRNGTLLTGAVRRGTDGRGGRTEFHGGAR
jgi:hypothetical protein